MQKIIIHIGRTPELSIRELESVFGEEIKPITQTQTVLLDTSSEKILREFSSLGGSVRAGEVLFSGNFEESMNMFPQKVLEQHIVDKKQRIGIHILPQEKGKKIFHHLFSLLKKQAKQKEYSIRIVNRGEQSLDAFAVQKEKLLSDGHGEFWFVMGKAETVIARTIAVQDPESFAKRDYGKPERDMQVGMLPPKLALMMLNLSREQGILPSSLYDPFCGTGTMLTEAQLLDITPFGSDRSQNMVQASRKNFSHFFPQKQVQVFVHDVHAPFPDFVSQKTIVSEGFLGNMYAQPISNEQFFQEKDILLPLYSKFLCNASIALSPRIILAIPFWKGKTQYYSFSQKLLEKAKEFSYESVSDPILYRRPDQVVGREILVLGRLGE
jgi:tRNA G10  N-methylase Trm11